MFKKRKRGFCKKDVSVKCESTCTANILEVRLEENDITPRPRPTHNDTDDVVNASKVKLDTEKVYKLKYEEVLGRYGKKFSPELRLAVLGRKDVDCAKVIIKATNIPLTPEEFSMEVKALQTSAMLNNELKPGAERLIKHLSSNRIPIAVATSSSHESYEFKVTNHKQLMSLFHHVVTGGSDADVKRGKPDPDIYLVCASRFPDNPSPSKCLVLEDAHNGVQGARAAGMQVVMVPEDFLPLELTKEATIVLKTLEEFRPELFGLPKFL